MPPAARPGCCRRRRARRTRWPETACSKRDRRPPARADLPPEHAAGRPPRSRTFPFPEPLARSLERRGSRGWRGDRALALLCVRVTEEEGARSRRDLASNGPRAVNSIARRSQPNTFDGTTRRKKCRHSMKMLFSTSSPGLVRSPSSAVSRRRRRVPRVPRRLGGSPRVPPLGAVPARF